MRIDNDGIGLHVAADGPDDGPPVLFLHGISGSTATYDFLVPDLPGHRLLRLDFRGHGQSTGRPTTTSSRASPATPRPSSIRWSAGRR